MKLLGTIECANCGAEIAVQVTMQDAPTEFAVTCDCGKTNWLTLKPIREDDA